MVLNQLGTPTKRKIVGITLAGLSLAQLPVVGPIVKGILDYSIVAPVTVGVVVGAIGAVGAYLILTNQGV